MTTSNGSASNCATPGISSTAVRLGLLWPNSGVFAPTIADFRGGIDARIDLENRQGGVNGRSISYDWADDGSDLDRNLAGARDLVETKRDFAIIEATTSETGSARYLSTQGVPVIGLGTSDVWNKNANMFTWASLSVGTATTSAWGDFARQHGGTRAAVLALSVVPNSRALAQSMAASMRAAGISVVYQDLDVSTSANLPALAAAIARSGANVVTGVMIPEIWSGLAPALSRAGAHIDVPIFPLGYDQTTLEKLGAPLAGTYIGVVNAPFELKTPAYSTFFSAMAQSAPQIQPVQNEYAVDGWIAADLMIRGLRAAGDCPTRQSLISGLRKVDSFDGDGLIRPAVNLANFRQPNSCLNLVKVDPTGRVFQPQGQGPMCGRIISGR